MTTLAAGAREPWQTHFGFTRSPFGKTLAPSELFTRTPHEEAVARIRTTASPRRRSG